LQQHRIATEERDMSKRPLTADELDGLIGDRPVTEFLNARNELFRERGFKSSPPARAEAIRLMVEHPNLIRRPLLVLGDRVLFGFDPAEYERLAP
jgi:arsenate reductase-like glutaredoxin family protein